MTEYDRLDVIQRLISCRDQSLTVPQIQRIRDVHQFMAENMGDIVALKERLDAETQQCRDILNILQEELNLKMYIMDKVKRDLMALKVEMQKPNAALRFLVNNESIQFYYSDELECKECEIHEALDWINEKMTKVYVEIVGLSSDVEYISYLKSTAQLNIRIVEFYEDVFGLYFPNIITKK